MITCRRAVSEDASLFREIRLQALLDSPAAFGSTYESAVARDLPSWQEQLDLTVSGGLRNTQFAFDGDKCVGIAAVYRERGLSHGELIMMWVSPHYRGTHAASLLMTALTDWAAAVGFEAVHLTVTHNNDRAVTFYRKCGFLPTEEKSEVDSVRESEGIRMTKTFP